MEHKLQADTILRWGRNAVIFLAALVVCLLILVFLKNGNEKLAASINNGYLPQTSFADDTPQEGLSLLVAAQASLRENTPLSYTMQNDTERTYAYGSIVALEIFIDDAWFQVPVRSKHVWDTALYHLPAQSSAVAEVDLTSFYTLTPGKYRLVKELKRSPYEQYRDASYDQYQDDGVFLFAEFTVME